MPSSHLIQEQLGQHIIDGVRQFVASDVPTVSDFERDSFDHVDDPVTRAALAQTLYGARWIYKTGLVLLVSGPERAAHVRAQIIDYASICEALLGEMIIHAHGKSLMGGTTKDFEDFNRRRPIHWGTITNPRSRVAKLQFWWRIEVAAESGIIHPQTAIHLRTLKKDRNSVHIHRGIGRGKSYFLNDAVFAFEQTLRVISQTRKWKQRHP